MDPSDAMDTRRDGVTKIGTALETVNRPKGASAGM